MKYIYALIILFMLLVSAFGGILPYTKVYDETVTADTSGDTLWTIAMDRVSSDIGYFDGWIYFYAGVGTGADTTIIDSTYMGWKMIDNNSNISRITMLITLPVYIDTNTTHRAACDWVIWTDIDLVDERWYRFLLYDPADPLPLPLFPVGASPTFYFESKATDTLTIRILFPYEQEIE